MADVGAAGKTPTAPIAAPKAAPAQDKGGGGLFGFVGDLFVGAGEGLWDMAKGIGTMVVHPIQTVKGIGYAVTHPAALYHAFVDPYTDAVAEGHPGKAIGRGIIEIGSFFIGAGEAGAAGKGAAAAGKLAEGANAAGKAAKLAGVGSKLAEGANAAGKAAKVAGAATKAGRAAGAASKAGKVAETASTAAKAAKAAEAAAAASKAGKIAELTGKAGEAARFAARLAEKPAITKAAALALKEANVSTKVAKAAAAASHTAYWEARAAGKSAQIAKAAAVAKAAEITGLAKGSAAVQKLASGAKLAGAATDASKLFAKSNYFARPLANSGKAVGGLADRGIAKVSKIGTYLKDSASAGAGKVSKAGTAIADAAKAAPARLGAAVEKVGAITLKDVALAPIALTKGAYASVKGILGKAVSGLPSSGKVAEVATAGAKAVPGLARAGLSKAGSLIVGAAKLPFKMTAKTVGMAVQAGKWAIAHPKIVATSGFAGRIGAGDGSIGDEQAAALAEKFGLEPSKKNVTAFVTEIQGYQGTAIGPDSGTPEEVQQLQTVLAALGHDVQPTGVFDEKTATAVIDFKTKAGITQTYLMADGTPAVNEYVDDTTAQAIVAALQGGGQAPPAAATPATGTPAPATPAPAAPAAPAGPAYKAYTVRDMDRATGLSGIARHYLGDASRWKEIYELNKDMIGDNPNLIISGQQLKMPADAKGLAPAKPAAAPVAVAAPAEAPKASNVIPDARIAEVAKQYGLQSNRANVEAFLAEIDDYKQNAIGPDVGDEESIRDLQRALKAAGGKVTETGKFDEATADAVIAFKEAKGLHAAYKLTDGSWAVNEYVDETTAEALAKAIKS